MECACGARRIDRQIGLEATPDAFIAELVAVFREVRRILRPDGTCWVNMGSSYSTGKGSNVTEQINRLLEGGSVFYADTGPRGVTGHGVGITLQHERAPEGELSGLLGPERNAVEYRHKDFGKVADLLADPRAIGAGPAVLGVIVNAPNAKVLTDKVEHGSVVSAQSDPQTEPIFAVLGASGAPTCEDDETTLPVYQTDEPRIAGGVRWHAAWHTFARQAFRKGLEDVYLVDQAVPLGDRPQTLAGLLCDFRVAKASEKQITLASIHGGLTLAISNVGQLWFVLRCGSIVPYSKLLEDASRFANALQAKQDLGMPWRFARALQEDGWILRSPIIWNKPNPMPESCTDRPTSAHEHVFLLTKRARYFYDSDAIAEPALQPVGEERRTGQGKKDELRATGIRNNNGTSTSILGSNQGAPIRACRNVWTIATHAFPAAHFATYPPALVERCIRAGTSERGCCAACGAPWVRQTSVSYTDAGNGNNNMKRKGGGDYEAAMSSRPYEVRKLKDVETLGWAPSCTCDLQDGNKAFPDPPVPCTVLDPFLGSGTTALVADRLQRHCIGIDLSLTYADLARNRVTDDCPLFTSWAPAEDPEERAMRDLFAEAAE
jgi:DNA modification methylase